MAYSALRKFFGASVTRYKPYTYSLHAISPCYQKLITDEKISGEALMAIEKGDIKDMGVQPTGRKILITAKIKELMKTQEKEKPTEVNLNQKWKKAP